MSYFIIETCIKLINGFRLATFWYTCGQAGRPVPPPKTEISDMALDWLRPMQFKSVIWSEFPVKISARYNFKGMICHWMVYSLHALPGHVFWAWCVFLKLGVYFLRNTQRTVCTGFLCPSNYPSWYNLYSVESDVKSQISKNLRNTLLKGWFGLICYLVVPSLHPLPRYVFWACCVFLKKYIT